MNTALLEYVLYKEDKDGKWEYLETAGASNHEYTSLPAHEKGIYNVEAYDFGMFLGNATNIAAKNRDVKITINAPKRKLVRVKVSEKKGSAPVAGVEVRIDTDQPRDKPMFSKVTDSKGETEFFLWPTLSPKEYYLVNVFQNGNEVHKSQPIQISQEEKQELILVGLDKNEKKERTR